MPSFRLLALTLALVAATVSIGQAQLRKIVAEVTPLAATDAVHAGSDVRLALAVKLPEHFHVQSNAPRDPSLIATELPVEAPAGVEVAEVVFPPAIDFKQEGLPEPLTVFEPRSWDWSSRISSLRSRSSTAEWRPRTWTRDSCSCSF